MSNKTTEEKAAFIADVFSKAAAEYRSEGKGPAADLLDACMAELPAVSRALLHDIFEEACAGI